MDTNKSNSSSDISNRDDVNIRSNGNYIDSDISNRDDNMNINTENLNTRYNRLTLSLAVLFLFLFSIFVFFYERYEYNKAVDHIKQHSVVISNALWNLDPKGAEEYLSLAAKSHNYKNIIVIDNKGNIFHSVENYNNSSVQKLLAALHLISNMNISSEITYSNRKIGKIAAVWQCSTIYLELYVLFAFVLIYAVCHLNIRLSISNNMLEKRVIERTNELYRVNESLHFEVEEHREAKEALHKSEEQYRLLIDNIPDVLYRTNMKGSILFISRSCENITGYTVDEMLGNDISKMLYLEPEARKEFISLLEKHEIVNNYECRLKRKDGSIWWSSTNAHFFKDSNNKTAGVEGVFRDVTSRKMLENQLRQAQKMESIGTLTGGIAHDFNNILGIMIGNAELAMSDIPKWNSAYSKIEAIKTAGQRASSIVKQLLSFTRATEIDAKPFNITDVVKESIQLLKATIPVSIKIETHIDEIRDSIIGNPTQIHQIIINLCINAFHAMKDMEGTIEVNIKKCLSEDIPQIINYSNQNFISEYSELSNGCYVMIEISDNGHGIPSKIIDRIFEPYFTTKPVDKGTGMGLAVAHGIVKNHKGIIAVNSIPNKKTTFTILLPLVTAATESSVHIQDKLYFGTERILFVDDDEFIVDMTLEMLGRLGYSVESSTEPEEAVKIFISKPEYFDLIITDMTMPQMSGAKFAQKIREIRKDIPVIVCSGYSSLMNEESAKEAGISAYIMKPVTMQELGQAIRSVLNSTL